MIGFDAIEGRSAREICGLHGRETIGTRPITPPEQILQRQGNSIFLVDHVERLAVRRGSRRARVEAELRRIDGEGLAVVNEATVLDVALIVDDEAGPTNLVIGRSIELDKYALIFFSAAIAAGSTTPAFETPLLIAERIAVVLERNCAMALWAGMIARIKLAVSASPIRVRMEKSPGLILVIQEGLGRGRPTFHPANP
jgi:hypothetical protein